MSTCSRSTLPSGTTRIARRAAATSAKICTRHETRVRDSFKAQERSWFKNSSVRPHQLLLTGDQSYADDVADSQRVACRARSADGGQHLWIVRRTRLGAGAASSGLRYDVAQD